MTLHGLQQRERCRQVVAVVLERVGDRFTHIRKGRKMEHGLRLVFCEELLDQRGVCHVSLHKGHAVQRQCLAVSKDEVVEHDDALILLQKMAHGMGADISCAAGDE